MLEKEKIIYTRTRDTKLFYRLVNKQRKSLTMHIDDLNVDGICFSQDNILEGFKQHFGKLAEPSSGHNYSQDYNNVVSHEVHCIHSLVEQIPAPPVTDEELSKAIKAINTGKSPDIYGITIEHVLHAGLEYQEALLHLINRIFQEGVIPMSLKTGLVTPIYKNKGCASEASTIEELLFSPSWRRYWKLF